MRAFPLGNGRIGAMLYGDPYEETIEINEESLWSGRQIQEKYNSSPEMLAKIRRLLLDEEYEEAAELCGKTFMASPERVRFYESMGELRIEFPDKSRYENYRKELELSEAIGRVSYKKGKTEFFSETFVSEKYDCLVYKVEASSEFDCYVTMERGEDEELAAAMERILDRLPALRVSERYGTLCEWNSDYEEVEPNHRHISHMFGLYPGDQINETNPEIYQAAKNTIARRLSRSVEQRSSKRSEGKGRLYR